MENCDIFGVGAGPSNLSLAALLSKTNINAHFCDKTTKFVWHAGMLLSGSKLQVSYLKDLVSLVDPTNAYSFLNYLQHKGALYQFITSDFKQISRQEFSNYLTWVFNKLDCIYKGVSTNEIIFDKNILTIKTSQGTYQTQKLVLGSGLVPYVPSYCSNFIGQKVFHNKDFMYQKTDWSKKRVAIIGGGQGGAEILHDMIADETKAPSEIYWLSKEQNFAPIDDSTFANELFTPKYAQYFYKLPTDKKIALLEKQRLASDGISMCTAESIYHKLYDLKFIHEKDELVYLLPGHKMVNMSQSGNEYNLHIMDLDNDIYKNLAVDFVILCTGYKYELPDFLIPIKEQIHYDKMNNIIIDGKYKLSWDGMEKCTIYMQNAARHSHGIADPNLSLLAYRSAVIVNDIVGYDAYSNIDGNALINWGLYVKNKSYDFVVIGGGIQGLMTAILAKIRYPNLSIAIIDKNIIGTGASLYSAGLSLPLSKGIRTGQIIDQGINVINEVAQYVELNLVVKPCIYIVDKNNVTKFKKQYYTNDLQEINHSKLEHTSLGSFQLPDNKVLFMSESGAHYTNVAEITNIIRNFLRSKGCDIYETCAVNEVIPSSGFSMIKCEHNLDIFAHKIFLSTGAWSNDFGLTNEASAIRLVKKIVAFHIQPLPLDTDPIIVMYDEEAFLLPIMHKKQWLLSITSKDWSVDPNQQLTISTEDMIMANNVLQDYGLSFDSLFSGGRVFCDSYSSNGEINIQELSSNISGVFGASGSGYRLSYGVADMVVRQLIWN